MSRAQSFARHGVPDAVAFGADQQSLGIGAPNHPAPSVGISVPGPPTEGNSARSMLRSLVPRQSSDWWLLGASALLSLLLAAAAALLVWDTRNNAIADARRELQGASTILTDYTERAFGAVEQALDATLLMAAGEGALESAEAFSAWGAREQTHLALQQRTAALAQLDVMLLIDAEGRLITSGRFFPVPARDLSDRAYFHGIAGGSWRAMGPPVLNRGTNTMALHLARRIEAQDQAFLGVAVAVIELSYLEGVFAGLSLPRGAAVGLFGMDGALYTHVPPLPPDAAHGNPVRPHAASGRMVDDHQGRDGLRRIAISHAVPSYPVVIDVSFSHEAIFAAWRRSTSFIAIGTAFLVALIAIVMLVALQARRAERRAGLERLARQKAVADQHARFRAAVEGMPQGVWMLDAAGRLVLSNTLGADIPDLPAALLQPGQPVESILAAASRTAEHAPLIEPLRALLARTESGTAEAEISDRRTLSIACRPLPDGGRVVTFEDISERRAAEARVRHLARHDPLTGLPNRAALRDRLQQSLHARDVSPSAGRVALLYLDLDRFKQVNDILGHAAGDALLRAAAARIQLNLRSGRDGRPGDLLARMGGDEFVAVLDLGHDDLEGARAATAVVAERLVKALAEPFDLNGQQALIGTTVGVAIHPEDGADSEALLRAADLALYQAKAEGRQRHRFFDAAMDIEARRRHEIEEALRRCLHEQDARDIEVHFQPVVDVRDRRPTGCEALVRWRRDGAGGLVPPSEFIPIAEETGLIGQLGAVVLQRACRAAASWSDTSLRVAVNLSPVQFRSPGLVETVTQVLAETGLAPQRLELEITEGVLLRGTQEALAAMHSLRAIGVRFAMDDFGTGYSSLAYLRAFPFDRVKVDRAFVCDAETRRAMPPSCDRSRRCAANWA